jgi:hypothetical protein
MNNISLPGAAWVAWLKNHPLRIGVLSGFYLTVVMAGGLLVANRMPDLDGLALIRNASCALLFFLVALVPICVFLRSPWQMFVAGITGWLILSLAYAAAGSILVHLHTRLGVSAFHVLLLGTGGYAVVAVGCWVTSMLVSLLSHLPHPSAKRAAHNHE